MKIILYLILGLLAVSCQSGPVQNDIPLVNADSLVSNLSQYTGKKIKLEGKIIHVCPVKGQKMKLLCDNKTIVKIVPADTTACFEHSWNGKRVSVTGTVQEIRFSRQYLDSITSGAAPLCHIDHAPCLDTVWVANMQRQGKAKASLQRDSLRFHQTMQAQGTDYVSLIVLSADRIEAGPESTGSGQ